MPVVDIRQQEDVTEHAEDVRKLRDAYGVGNDTELAEVLGISRFAVSKWKTRGVPSRYRHELEITGPHGIESAFKFIIRSHVFSDPMNHYWLRAAIYFLPFERLSGIAPASRAEEANDLLTALMSVAIDATVRSLGKPRCKDESDFVRLIELMSTEYAGRVTNALSGAPTATPL